MLFGHKKNKLTTSEMIKLEEWLEANCIPHIGPFTSEEDLSARLKLKVEYVDPKNLDKFVEAELVPATSPEFNGLIKVSAKCEGNAFAYLHEIIHYIYDVGIGNRVNETFARMSKGHTKTEHEQKINYMAAAYSMRYDKVEPKIREYDESRPKMDELKFVSDMCREFNQPRAVVIRRIQEVRRIKQRKERV